MAKGWTTSAGVREGRQGYDRHASLHPTTQLATGLSRSFASFWVPLRDSCLHRLDPPKRANHLEARTRPDYGCAFASQSRAQCTTYRAPSLRALVHPSCPSICVAQYSLAPSALVASGISTSKVILSTYAGGKSTKAARQLMLHGPKSRRSCQMGVSSRRRASVLWRFAGRRHASRTS